MAERSQDEEQKFNRQVAAGFVVLVVILASVVFYAAIMSPEYQHSEHSTTTPTATYSKSSYTNGQMVTIVAISRDVEWDDVGILLMDGPNIVTWSPETKDLDGGAPVFVNYSTRCLGHLTVCCEVADRRGDGCVDGLDFFLVYTFPGAPGFAPTTEYEIFLVYEPTGERIGEGITFTG